MVALDADGEPVHDALLWNDTRSGADAQDLVQRYGADWWAEQTGSVPVASFTVTKLAWLARERPEIAARVAQVMLPHDWLTWRLRGDGEATTDRGDASGTGYFSPSSGEYLRELLVEVLGHDVELPRVLGPGESPGSAGTVLLGPGTGDNMAAALGRFTAVFLDDSDLHPRVRERIALTRGIVEDEAAGTVTASAKGAEAVLCLMGFL